MVTNLFLTNKSFRISKVEKQHLVDAYRRGEDYLYLSRQLEICESAARGIIYRYQKNGCINVGHRGGHKRAIITDHLGMKILQFLDENPTAFLREIKQFLFETEGMQCSRNTISRYLEGKLITLKKVHACVQDRNSVAVKEKRFDYAMRFLSEGWRSKNLIFIDEIGFNIWTTRQNARSRRGMPASVTIPTNRGRNVSLIMAIGKNGPIHHQICLSTVNHDIYQTFIEELSSKLDDQPYCLIHDNASIHLDTISIYRVHNLPPYSPFLNPIEAVFSKLKRGVRKQMSEGNLLPMTQRNRIDFLQTAISQELLKVDYSDLRPYYRHCKTFLGRCIAKHNIFGD